VFAVVRRAVALCVVAVAGLLTVSVPQASARAADCHAYNVLVGTRVVNGRPKIHATATVVCTTRPSTFRARVTIQQRMRVGGRLRWEAYAYGPVDRHIPSPTRRYPLQVACRRGTFRTKVAIGGWSSSGDPMHRNFFSTPAVVRACVSGSAAEPSRQALPVVSV
jgi:hypothetical protein